jgi:hypothetical protein
VEGRNAVWCGGANQPQPRPAGAPAAQLRLPLVLHAARHLPQSQQAHQHILVVVVV